MYEQSGDYTRLLGLLKQLPLARAVPRIMIVFNLLRGSYSGTSTISLCIAGDHKVAQPVTPTETLTSKSWMWLSHALVLSHWLVTLGVYSSGTRAFKWDSFRQVQTQLIRRHSHSPVRVSVSGHVGSSWVLSRWRCPSRSVLLDLLRGTVHSNEQKASR
jgi:hypothetical protein